MSKEAPEGAVYAGQSAIERRDTRRRRLLDAGLELVGRDGWASLSVRGVCAEAKLTARYFYESFADRDALAAAVFDVVGDITVRRVLAAFIAAPDDVLEKARASIGAMADLIASEPRNAIILYAPVDGLPSVARRRVALTRRFAALVQERGRDLYGVAPNPDIDTAATMLAGGLSQTLLDWATGALIVEREDLVENCALMCVGMGNAVAVRLHSRHAEDPAASDG